MTALGGSPSEADRMRRGSPAGLELLVLLPECQRDPDFPSAPRQAAWKAELSALGARTVVWAHEAQAEAAVDALRRELGVAVVPVVPNMRAYLRDASDDGVIGAARQRFLRLGPLDQVRIGLHHAPHAGRVLRRDFATGILILAEMELARFRRFRPTQVLLSASVTDLALALDRIELLRDFVRLAERRYGLEAGLATYNYGRLEARLRERHVRPALVAAPFNPRGYLMNPSREACEAALREAGVPVLATHLEVDGLVPRPVAVAYLDGLGIRRAVLGS